MKRFSMPADFKIETLDKYDLINKKYSYSKIYETYGQITLNNYLESGRSMDHLPKIDIHQLRNYVDYSIKKGIDFNYTLNAFNMKNREFTKEGITELYKFLDQLYDIGIKWLTITLPSLIEIVKNSKYDFYIKASTICQITSANKAIQYKKMGVDRIVLDESINRNFSTMKQIIDAFGDEIDIIINPICNKDCIFRMFHYNQISYDSVKVNNISSNYYSYKCALRWYDDLNSLIRINWIRPEDIKFYTGIGLKNFKVQGRHFILKGYPIKTIESYINESFEGNIMDLITMFSNFNPFKISLDNKKLDNFIKPFVNNENFCKNYCDNCRYCDDFAAKSIDFEKSIENSKLAKAFYKENDQFKKLIDRINSSNNNEKDINIFFNFNN